MGTRGSLPPYTSGIWSSSISASRVELNFLFSTKLIWRNHKTLKSAKREPRTVLMLLHLDPRRKRHRVCFLGVYLLLCFTIDERVNHLPHGHEHVRYVYYEQSPEPLGIAVLTSENKHNQISSVHQQRSSRTLFCLSHRRRIETCRIERAARYPRMSLFVYPHPPRSPMATNFSFPGGILEDPETQTKHE